MDQPSVSTSISSDCLVRSKAKRLASGRAYVDVKAERGRGRVDNKVMICAGVWKCNMQRAESGKEDAINRSGEREREASD
jgi:hypothetical protein